MSVRRRMERLRAVLKETQRKQPTIEDRVRRHQVERVLVQLATGARSETDLMGSFTPAERAEVERMIAAQDRRCGRYFEANPGVLDVIDRLAAGTQ